VPSPSLRSSARSVFRLLPFRRCRDNLEEVADQSPRLPPSGYLGSRCANARTTPSGWRRICCSSPGGPHAQNGGEPGGLALRSACTAPPLRCAGRPRLPTLARHFRRSRLRAVPPHPALRTPHAPLRRMAPSSTSLSEGPFRACATGAPAVAVAVRRSIRHPHSSAFRSRRDRTT